MLLMQLMKISLNDCESCVYFTYYHNVFKTAIFLKTYF